ncbi:ANTAR domain-containing response regulator [Neptunomonas japonica]|uniref:ANTAR domain-containing response regulator n=1 Tax=Neptunomonas japonica TaxID=417574 RepID=UPI00040F9FF4|nr:ANTAR domain-containing protein [Neptunomonas japonica]
MKSRLTVLVINENIARESELENTLLRPLREQGYDIVEELTSTQYLADKANALQPNLVIISLTSLDKADLENIALMAEHCSRPIVIFAEQGNQQMTEQAIRTGVSACVVDGLEPHRIKHIVDVAVARFEELQAMHDALRHAHNELDQARAELAERKLIEKAKGLIMKHNHCAESQAFKALQKMAMDQQKPLSEVAKSIIAVLGKQSNSITRGHS